MLYLKTLTKNTISMTNPAFELYKQTKEYHQSLRQASLPNYSQLEEEESVKEEYLEYCSIRRQRGPELEKFMAEFKTWPYEDQMAWFLGDTATPLVRSFSVMSAFHRDHLLDKRRQATFVPLHFNKLDSQQLYDFLHSLAQKTRTSIINNSISSPVLRRMVSDAFIEQSFEQFERILLKSGGELESFINNVEYLNAVAPSFLEHPSEEMLNLSPEELDELMAFYSKSIEIRDPDSGLRDEKLNKWLSKKSQYILEVLSSKHLSSVWDVAIIYLVIYVLSRDRCDSVEKEVFDVFLDNPVFPELRPLCEAKAKEVLKELDELDVDTGKDDVETPNDVEPGRPDEQTAAQKPGERGKPVGEPVVTREPEGEPGSLSSKEMNGAMRENGNDANGKGKFVFALPDDYFEYKNQEEDVEKRIGKLEDGVINAGVLAFTDIIVALTYKYKRSNGAPLRFLVADKDNLRLVADILAGKKHNNPNDVKWVDPNDLETEKVVLYLAFKLFQNNKGKYHRAYRLLLPKVQPSFKKDLASRGRSANYNLRQEINSILEHPRHK